MIHIRTSEVEFNMTTHTVHFYFYLPFLFSTLFAPEIFIEFVLSRDGESRNKMYRE